MVKMVIVHWKILTKHLPIFIRGDVSRNTEGSGLGLSIAKDLVQLQGGEFKLYLDGDLFKVTIEFRMK